MNLLTPLGKRQLLDHFRQILQIFNTGPTAATAAFLNPFTTTPSHRAPGSCTGCCVKSTTLRACFPSPLSGCATQTPTGRGGQPHPRSAEEERGPRRTATGPRRAGGALCPLTHALPLRAAALPGPSGCNNALTALPSPRLPPWRGKGAVM